MPRVKREAKLKQARLICLPALERLHFRSTLQRGCGADVEVKKQPPFRLVILQYSGKEKTHKLGPAKTYKMGLS